MSTVTLAGETLPAAHLICPRTPEQEDESEWDSCLPTDLRAEGSVWVPSENGCLFEIEPHGETALASCGGGLGLSISHRTCHVSYEGNLDGALWLPASITLVESCLLASEDPCLGTWRWDHADPDWVVETILRLSHKPVTLPPHPGPSVRLVPLSYQFDRERSTELNPVVEVPT